MHCRSSPSPIFGSSIFEPRSSDLQIIRSSDLQFFPSPIFRLQTRARARARARRKSALGFLADERAGRDEVLLRRHRDGIEVRRPAVHAGAIEDDVVLAVAAATANPLDPLRVRTRRIAKAGRRSRGHDDSVACSPMVVGARGRVQRPASVARRRTARPEWRSARRLAPAARMDFAPQIATPVRARVMPV